MSEADDQTEYTKKEVLVAVVILIIIGFAVGFIYHKATQPKKVVYTPISQQNNVAKTSTFTSKDYGFSFSYPSFWFADHKLTVREVPEYQRQSGTAYSVGSKGYTKYTGGFVTRDWVQTTQEKADNPTLASVAFNDCNTFQNKLTTSQILYQADGVCAKLFGNSDPVNGTGAFFVVEKRFDNNPHTGALVFMSAPIPVKANTKADINFVYDAATRKAIVDFAKSIKETTVTNPSGTGEVPQTAMSTSIDL